MENLTRAQKQKWMRLSKAYPEFCEKSTIILSTSQIGEAMGIRSSDVFRDLTRISRRLGHRLRLQIMIQDSRKRFFPATRDDIRNLKKIRGGRQKKTSAEKGFQGNSWWINLSLVTK